MSATVASVIAIIGLLVSSVVALIGILRFVGEHGKSSREAHAAAITAKAERDAIAVRSAEGALAVMERMLQELERKVQSLKEELERAQQQRRRQKALSDRVTELERFVTVLRAQLEAMGIFNGDQS